MSYFAPKRFKVNRLKKFKRLLEEDHFTKRSRYLEFGNYGLKSAECSIITIKMLETLRLFLRKQLKRRGRIYFRISPNLTISKKPVESRMGKGKGPFKEWAYRLKKGQIIVELNGISESLAEEILKKACEKLPFNCKVILKDFFKHKRVERNFNDSSFKNLDFNLKNELTILNKKEDINDFIILENEKKKEKYNLKTSWFTKIL